MMRHLGVLNNGKERVSTFTVSRTEEGSPVLTHRWRVIPVEPETLDRELAKREISVDAGTELAIGGRLTIELIEAGLVIVGLDLVRIQARRSELLHHLMSLWRTGC